MSRAMLERIFFIDHEIRAGRYPSTVQMSEIFEVTRRTIQRDIEFMRERLSAPIAYDRHRKGYYYRDDNWMLPAIFMSEGDLIALLAGMCLSAGGPLYERIEPVLSRLARIFPKQIPVDLELLRTTVVLRSLAPRRPARFLPIVVDALRQQRRLRITYRSPTTGETVRIVEPYRLVSIRGEPYLIAFCHLRKQVRTFVPSRIVKAQILEDEPYEIPQDFSVEDYFQPAFRFIHGEPAHIVLHFSPEVARVVRERRWHPTQRLREERDGSVILEMRVPPTEELASWVLSWRGACVVVEPREFRRLVHAFAATISDSHKEPNNAH